MAPKVSPYLGKVSKLPAGMPFVQLSIELICSPAWRALSINGRRLIDFLLIRHMEHGGSENGNLLATYDELEEFGIARRLLRKTIQEVENLRLIDVERGGRKGFTQTHYSRFRLTFLPDRNVSDRGINYFGEPTNEWRRVTPKQAAQIAGKKDSHKFENLGYEGEPSQCTNVNQDSATK